MIARLFLAVALMFTAIAGASSTSQAQHTPNCDQCEDIPYLLGVLQLKIIMLKHYQDELDKMERTGKAPKDVSAGARAVARAAAGTIEIPYAQDLDDPECRIVVPIVDKNGAAKRDSKGYLEGTPVSPDDLKYGDKPANSKTCPIEFREEADHELSHHADCRKIWFSEHGIGMGRPQGPGLSLSPEEHKDPAKEAKWNYAWKKAEIETEIKAYKVSINILDKYIKDLLEKCTEKASKCKRQCVADLKQKEPDIKPEDKDKFDKSSKDHCAKLCRNELYAYYRKTLEALEARVKTISNALSNATQ